MRRRALRVVPSLIALALLALASAAPRKAAHARGSAPEQSQLDPTCVGLVGANGGDSSFTIVDNAGVVQPLAVLTNAAACSLTIVAPYWGQARMTVVQWDSDALAPDPTTIALRTRTYTPSEMGYYKNEVRFNLAPPVVQLSVTGAADPPRSSLAMAFDAIDLSWPIPALLNPSGDPSMPAAFQHAPSSGVYTPVPGSHPVFNSAWCTGDGTLQALRVVQSVMTANLALGRHQEYLQRFRVPAPTVLHWIELAFDVNTNILTPAVGVVAVVDPRGAVLAPPTMPPSMIEAPFQHPQIDVPVWGTHAAFDHFVLLQPSHDYWLVLRSAGDHPLRGRALTGTESATFTAGIGALDERIDDISPWTSVPGQVLAFRLIGEPATDVGVAPRAVPVRATFALRVAPNPAPGARALAWSSAVGPVTIAALDARGRRVGGSPPIEGATRWLWSASRDDGRPLAPGVYFARAVDREGHVALARMVLVR